MLIERQPAVRLPVGASPVQACRPARSRSSHCLNAPTRPESHMLDWLTWPADQLLRIGGVVAGWFFSRDETSFTVVQMMFATLVLAAFVTLLVFWQRLVEYCRSLWKTR